MIFINNVTISHTQSIGWDSSRDLHWCIGFLCSWLHHQKTACFWFGRVCVSLYALEYRHVCLCVCVHVQAHTCVCMYMSDFCHCIYITYGTYLRRARLASLMVSEASVHSGREGMRAQSSSQDVRQKQSAATTARHQGDKSSSKMHLVVCFLQVEF